MTQEWKAEFYRLVTALSDANFECGAWEEGDGSYGALTDNQAEARKALCEFVLSSRPEATARISDDMVQMIRAHLIRGGADDITMLIRLDEHLGCWSPRLEPQNRSSE